MKRRAQRQAGFGIHLTLDLRDCDCSKLGDLDLVSGLLESLPDLLAMTKVTPPYVFRYSGKIPEDKGITGFVVIAESHISIHTFEMKAYAFVDVFSCKWFDCDVAAEQIENSLGAKHVVRTTVTRGEDFPRDRKRRSV